MAARNARPRMNLLVFQSQRRPQKVKERRVRALVVRNNVLPSVVNAICASRTLAIVLCRVWYIIRIHVICASMTLAIVLMNE